MPEVQALTNPFDARSKHWPAFDWLDARGPSTDQPIWCQVQALTNPFDWLDARGPSTDQPIKSVQPQASSWHCSWNCRPSNCGLCHSRPPPNSPPLVKPGQRAPVKATDVRALLVLRQTHG